MTETLVTIHSIWRWLVLVGLAAAPIYGFARPADAPPLDKTTGRPFSLALIILDIQVLIGLLVWLAGRGWELNVFLAWIHPVGMILALGLGHALVGRAIKPGGSGSYRGAALGILGVLIIVGGLIPTGAWF